VITVYDDRDDEFLGVACQAMAGPSGAAALDALGWWELLPELVDSDARAAVFGVFRAQGRELASSLALGGILAQPFIDGTAIAPGTVAAAMLRHSTRRGPVWVLIGDLGERLLLVDEPGRGVGLVAPDAIKLRPVEVPGKAIVNEVSFDPAAAKPILAEEDARLARARSTYLGRVAAASEMLGATERAVELAVQYAKDRQQFGRPIGTFQAVRHLLAWAKTDCIAVDSVIRRSLLLLDEPPARYDEVVKALAGRNGRRGCERSLQVLGGIGFTAEHDHHHHHSRVLLLDSLLGSSAALSRGLGTWLRTTGTDPGFTAATLLSVRR